MLWLRPRSICLPLWIGRTVDTNFGGNMSFCGGVRLPDFLAILQEWSNLGRSQHRFHWKPILSLLLLKPRALSLRRDAGSPKWQRSQGFYLLGLANLKPERQWPQTTPGFTLWRFQFQTEYCLDPGTQHTCGESPECRLYWSWLSGRKTWCLHWAALA